jgi:type II secretory pathway component PulL
MASYIEAAETHGYEVEEIIIDGDALPWDENYIDMCVERNIHSVPREAIEKMAQRFQI